MLAPHVPQTPPQPSGPHARPAHWRVQHWPVMALHVPLAPQSPHDPPQPSGPQTRPEQTGAHASGPATQAPPLHICPLAHEPHCPPQPSSPHARPAHWRVHVTSGGGAPGQPMHGPKRAPSSVQVCTPVTVLPTHGHEEVAPGTQARIADVSAVTPLSSFGPIGPPPPPPVAPHAATQTTIARIPTKPLMLSSRARGSSNAHAFRTLAFWFTSTERRSAVPCDRATRPARRATRARPTARSSCGSGRTCGGSARRRDGHRRRPTSSVHKPTSSVHKQRAPYTNRTACVQRHGERSAIQGCDCDVGIACAERC